MTSSAAPATRRIDIEAAHRRIHELDEPGRWVEAARALTADLGFLLLGPGAAGGDRARPGSHLLVALRDEPTLRHFDPESISYYAPLGEGAGLTGIGRLPAGRAERRSVLWGHVHVVDRVPVENRFLTFGGTLELVAVDASLTIADLRSPAPIVRWGGHSQGTDALTLAIGAFFGRLIVPVDFMPGAAARIDSEPPEVLYAAFVADTTRRAHTTRRLLGEPAELDRWLAAAWSRIRDDRATCAAAEQLLTDVGI